MRLLIHRLRLAERWIPANTARLLDAGCAAGLGTARFARKATDTWGIDMVADGLVAARRRCPDIHFARGSVEHLPFADRAFDVVVLTEVLEHVQDERAALNEIYRVTRPGATVILTTPHAGLFAWLDPYNYGSVLRRHWPGTYRVLRRARLALSSTPDVPMHRHYTRQDLQRLLDTSSFGSSYIITKTFRSGCLMCPLVDNVFEGVRRLLPLRTAEILTTPLRCVYELDYWTPFGALAYHIALCIKRTETP
jgi:SAM-dependent methyltransferase